MKIFPALLIVLFFVSGCTEGRKKQNTSTCYTVWNGTFYNEHNNEVDTRIIRKGDIQLEYYKNHGACSFKVEWLDSCQYRLTYIPGGKGCPLTGELKPVTVQIIEVRESSYTIEGWVDEKGLLKYKSELHRAKQH